MRGPQISILVPWGHFWGFGGH